MSRIRKMWCPNAEKHKEHKPVVFTTKSICGRCPDCKEQEQVKPLSNGLRDAFGERLVISRMLE